MRGLNIPHAEASANSAIGATQIGRRNDRAKALTSRNGTMETRSAAAKIATSDVDHGSASAVRMAKTSAIVVHSDRSVYRKETTDYRESNSVLDAIDSKISPGYLRAAGTRLLSGRDFTWHDDEKAPRVAIVNATFARIMFGNGSPTGQSFQLKDKDSTERELYEIVGVIEDSGRLPG